MNAKSREVYEKLILLTEENKISWTKDPCKGDIEPLVIYHARHGQDTYAYVIRKNIQYNLWFNRESYLAGVSNVYAKQLYMAIQTSVDSHSGSVRIQRVLNIIERTKKGEVVWKESSSSNEDEGFVSYIASYENDDYVFEIKKQGGFAKATLWINQTAIKLDGYYGLVSKLKNPIQTYIEDQKKEGVIKQIQNGALQWEVLKPTIKIWRKKVKKGAVRCMVHAEGEMYSFVGYMNMKEHCCQGVLKYRNGLRSFDCREGDILSVTLYAALYKILQNQDKAEGEIKTETTSIDRIQKVIRATKHGSYIWKKDASMPICYNASVGKKKYVFERTVNENTDQGRYAWNLWINQNKYAFEEQDPEARKLHEAIRENCRNNVEKNKSAQTTSSDRVQKSIRATEQGDYTGKRDKAKASNSEKKNAFERLDKRENGQERHIWNLWDEPLPKKKTVAVAPKPQELKNGERIIVRSNLWKCRSDRHKLRSLVASIKIRDKNGRETSTSANVAYCEKCNCYIMHDDDYERVSSKGRILLPVQEYSVFANGGKNSLRDIKNGESILKKAGYTVAENKKLPSRMRQQILADLMDKGKLTAPEVLSYLEFFKASKKNQPNYQHAIQKWNEDIQFVMAYQTSARMMNANRKVAGISHRKR